MLLNFHEIINHSNVVVLIGLFRLFVFELDICKLGLVVQNDAAEKSGRKITGVVFPEFLDFFLFYILSLYVCFILKEGHKSLGKSFSYIRKCPFENIHVVW